VITAIGDLMRKAYDKGWITTRDGNISLRYAGESMCYITPSAWRKTIIHPEHLVNFEFHRGQVITANGSNPSGELDMHARILKYAKDTRSVVHLHPTNIVAAIYGGWNLQEIAAEFPEVSRYTKVGPSVPILPATSNELAAATEQNLGVKTDGTLDFDIVGQANHGCCSVGKDPWEAFEHIERLDHICQIVLASGRKPKLSRKLKNLMGEGK